VPQKSAYPHLSVAALELPHRFGAPHAQLLEIDRLLTRAAGADLALLPECALTGYVSANGEYDLRGFAEPLEGPTARALAQLARTHQIALAGPLIELDGAAHYNAFVVFDRTGTRIAHYRKRHPWYVETWATPGTGELPLFEIDGARITLAICFDLHFLKAESAAILGEAQLLLFPSAWVDDGGPDERDHLLPDLARTFELGIANANWGPGAPRVGGQGGSRIVDAAGRELARSTGVEGGAIALARF
jgi:predicted amidohydrolase